ncbi:MAG: ComEA family DNA-binding protein [Acidiferrobacterales bacterium]
MKTIRALLLVLLCFVAGWALAAEPVNINTADVQTLVTLEGVGEKRAQAIIEYREKHGPFEAVDDLVKVKGVGKKTVEKNRPNMTVQ